MAAFVYLSGGISYDEDYADLLSCNQFAAALVPLALASAAKYHGTLPTNTLLFRARVCPYYDGPTENLAAAITAMKLHNFIRETVIDGKQWFEPVPKSWWKYPREGNHDFTQSVKRRDKRCLLCGSTQKLQAHHIKPVRSHPELQDDPDNGATLCATCHKATYRREHLYEERLTQLVAGA